MDTFEQAVKNAQAEDRSQDYFDALEEARGKNLSLDELEDYALTIETLSAGDDPFSDDGQFRDWQEWCEAKGLAGWPNPNED